MSDLIINWRIWCIHFQVHDAAHLIFLVKFWQIRVLWFEISFNRYWVARLPIAAVH